jgi:hypothetical protein
MERLQAYRRGLGTNLKQLGVEDGVSQAILRQQNVETTRRYYIKTARKDSVSAMRKLDKKSDVQQLCSTSEPDSTLSS